MAGKQEMGMLTGSSIAQQYSDDEPDKDVARQLNDFSEVLLQSIPTRVSDPFIHDLEHFLNRLYKYAFKQHWPPEMQEAVLEALSRASELSYTITQRETCAAKNRDFFKTLKSLVPILKMVAVFLEE